MLQESENKMTDKLNTDRADEAAVLKAREAYKLAYATAFRACRWADAAREAADTAAAREAADTAREAADTAREAAVTAHQIADAAWESWATLARQNKACHSS